MKQGRKQKVNKNKKWVKLWCVAMTLAVIASGCSGNGGADGQNSGGASPGKESPAGDKPTAPVKFSMMHSNSNQAFPGGKIADDPWFKLVGEKTNTILEAVFLPHAQYLDQVRVRLAAGENPDVLQEWHLSQVEEVIGELPIPLNAYIDQYGSNLKKAISKEAWDSVSRDGKIYAIPQTSYVGNAGSERLFFVRKDWMDKAGIKEAPQTSDDFLNMLRAFRDLDPAGSGGTIPFTMREKMSWGDNIFGMFGFDSQDFSFINGQYIPNTIHPRMKDAIAYFRTMYEEKLIDSEFLTQKAANWGKKITTNKAGVWVHQHKSDYQKSLFDANPDAAQPSVVQVISTPRAPGVTGPVGTLNTPAFNIYVITKTAKDPAAIVRYFDFLASEEGQALTYLGVPGDTFTKEGDTYKYDRTKDKGKPWRITLFAVKPVDAVANALYGEDAANRLRTQAEVAAKEGIKNLFPPMFDALKENPDLKVDGALFQEMFASIVLGNQPIDAYDKFVDTWKKQGGEQLIKQATEWYNQFKK
jgi:putative aldouronate transport system substrate-binding protein